MYKINENNITSIFPNEIPKWGDPYPKKLNRESVLEALTDYILQVNYRGYNPDHRKVLAVRTSDRTATLRNVAAPLRHEVYYFIEGELFTEGKTKLEHGRKPAELAEELVESIYEQLYIWVAYDLTKGSPPGFRKPFDSEHVVRGSKNPNPEQVTRRQAVKGINPQFFRPDPVPVYRTGSHFVSDLEVNEITKYVTNIVKTDFRNALPEGDNPPIWDTPLIGVSSAHDPLYERFQDPEVLGHGFHLPDEWLPGANSIISVFLPFTEHITTHYTREQRYSAIEFSSGKWNGSKFLNVIRRALIRFVSEKGGLAVAPNIDPRYDSDEWRPFWSERHAAFAAGLGTFGLHQNLISEKGALGRICSVITTLSITPSVRPYTDVYGYCLYALDGSCNACIRRCPTGAITEKGKIEGLCETHGNKEHFKDWNYGSCGHCSTHLPCSRHIPFKIRKMAGKPE